MTTYDKLIDALHQYHDWNYSLINGYKYLSHKNNGIVICLNLCLWSKKHSVGFNRMINTPKTLYINESLYPALLTKKEVYHIVKLAKKCLKAKNDDENFKKFNTIKRILGATE